MCPCYHGYRDLWENRVGVAKAMEQLPPHSTSSRVMDLLKFIIPGGLGDPSSEVQAGMMSAARAAISTHGEVGHLVAWFRGAVWRGSPPPACVRLAA